MGTYTRVSTIALLMVLAISAAAGSAVIPRDTVIPVTMDTALGSATVRQGSTFTAHHSGINGAGFPEQTEFTGRVDSVTRASGNTAGQVGVSFVSATLPNGTQVPLVGQVTSLDDRSVTTDQATGRLVGTSNARKTNM